MIRLTKKEAESLFHYMKFDKKSGQWKRKSHAVREFNKRYRVGKTQLSRPTLDKLIKLYPQGIIKKPKKLIRRYGEAFDETEAWKKLSDFKYAKEVKNAVFTAWRLLGQVEIEDWAVQDVRKLRSPLINGKDNTLFSPLTKDIKPESATHLRRAFRYLSLYELLKPLEGVPKRPAGTRRLWYLENDEIIKVTKGISHIEMLLFFVLDLCSGARPISMISMKVEAIKWDKLYIQYYESKTKEYVPRFFHPKVMKLLRLYVSDLRLKLTDNLFTKSKDWFTVELKRIGRKVGVEKLVVKGAGAYILRHTFATQAAEHDVSVEVVMKQGNWKDMKTLMDHYMFIKPAKMQRELLGLEVEKPKNFGLWLEQFLPLWESQYQQIRPKP